MCTLIYMFSVPQSIHAFSNMCRSIIRVSIVTGKTGNLMEQPGIFDVYLYLNFDSRNTRKFLDKGTLSCMN